MRLSRETRLFSISKKQFDKKGIATMVRNQGLRRSRYLGMEKASIHIIMGNMASNVIRMVNLLWEKPEMAC